MRRVHLTVGQAVALGLVQGPTEVLPVSSSAHLILLPSLFRWRYRKLSAAERKSFEVALHTGAAVALAAARPREALPGLRPVSGRRLAGLLLSTAPPALAGVLLERAVEERLGGPDGVARAQIAAGLALAAADRFPAQRRAREAAVADHLLIGLAQAAALAPGVSRTGAALTVLRARRFGRADAGRLSREAALPVLLAAAALKTLRLRRDRLLRSLAAPFAAGMAAAFASTLASSVLADRLDRARSYAPVAAYRVALGGLALTRKPFATRLGKT
jgi:undecaprenyl-diphosphatase